MSYFPILFNTEMVQAILAGRKTQTRRVVKNQDGIHPRWNNVGWVGWDDGHGYRMKPPCEVGDILWVRETWYDPEPDNFMVPVFYKADMPLHWDAENTAHGEAIDITADEFKWRPSIHMPKGFARIFLRVKDVRVDRLRDIGNADAIAEGFSGTPCHHEYADPVLGCTDCLNTGWLEPPFAEFAQLWDSTIKPEHRDVYGWDANPWVWVIEFERCDRPEGWPEKDVEQ